MLKYLLATIILLMPLTSEAFEMTPLQIEKMADAIYLAEGGTKTNFPYGIKSVKCEGEQECRRVCKNTIRNNIKRYNDYGHKKYDTYLEFLGSRYCPPTAHSLNKHWVKNVKFYYKKGRIR